ncbi:MAG: hypothetical protein R3E95_24630 [Thiolinea sp.]
MFIFDRINIEQAEVGEFQPVFFRGAAQVIVLKNIAADVLRLILAVKGSDAAGFPSRHHQSWPDKWQCLYKSG